MRLRKALLWGACGLAILAGCGTTTAPLSAKADEVFWVTSDGADMPVWVKGNTASKIMILIIHGGPGSFSLSYDNPETAPLQSRYGVAFWDQRDAGGSAGNSNFSDLSLGRMVLDLEKVVGVIKYRYGGDIEIFLYAHSFGGLLASAYLVKDSNQTNCKGWIDIDGAHDYPLCNTLERRMLIDTGLSEISAGRHTEEWREIVDYCQSHLANVSLDISMKDEDYAEAAETYMPISTNTYPFPLFMSSPPLSVGANALNMYYSSQGNAFLQTLETANETSGLSRVTIPSLLLWGRYDFTVPLGVGMEAYDSLGTPVGSKSLAVFDHSGHSPMEAETDAVNDTIVGFIEAYK